MQAIILAGGMGSRLRPLTNSIPKPLIKIMGEPVIFRLIRQLKEAGFSEASVCTFYLSDKIRQALGDDFEGVKIKYFREEYPLGTAGCVRNAWNGDDVLVLSGDGVTGYDYKDILSCHNKSGADITIVGMSVSDPREYGLMTVDERGFITGFLEKPGYDRCLTDLANTGCYVISKDVIARIPEGVETDFAKDVFPKILSEGKKLWVYKYSGLWHDIGDIPSLLRCQRELLNMSGFKNLIMSGANCGRGSVLSDTVMESGSALGSGSRAVSSLICENAEVASEADISEAVIGKNASIGRGLIMKSFSVIGEDCVVGSDVTVEAGVRIAPGTKIPDGAIIRADISAAEYSTLTFSETSGAMGIKSAEDYIRLGEIFASALEVKEIASGGTGEAYEPLNLGIRSQGADVYNLYGASLGETVYCARRLGCDYLSFCDGESVYLMSAYTMGLTRSEERKLEHGFLRSELIKKPFGRMIDSASEHFMYIKYLKNILSGCSVKSLAIRTENPKEAEIFKELFGAHENAEAVFSIASDRMTVSASTDETVIPYENLTALCVRWCADNQEDIVLSPAAPGICDKIAEESGRKVSRVPDEKTPLSMFVCDPLTMICKIAAYLDKNGIDLNVAVKQLPEVVYMKRVVDIPRELPKIMSETFKGTRAGNDIMVEKNGARAHVRPLKTGKAVQLYVESVSQEAAKELTADIETLLKKIF